MLVTPAQIEQRVRENGAILVLRGAPEPGALAELCQVLLEERFHCVELTTTMPDAVECLASLHGKFGTDLLLGMGTVTSGAQFKNAVEAGAKFLVSPHLDEGLIGEAQTRNCFYLPGVYTPSEVQRARVLGVEAVKLFPAEPASVSYMKALQGPFPGVRFYPSGGIGLPEASSYLYAGAGAVSLGGSLVGPPPWNLTEVRARIRHLRTVIDEAHHASQ